MKDYELLEKQAAMMRMAEKHGIDDWKKLVKVNGDIPSFIPKFDNLHGVEYKFALGVVEGRPVFEGDELYGYGGIKFIVPSLWRQHDQHDLRCSWNPPKPKTIMVELLVEDAKAYSIHLGAIATAQCPDGRLVEACRKALEAIK